MFSITYSLLNYNVDLLPDARQDADFEESEILHGS